MKKQKTKGCIKREDFIKDFLALTERVLLRELPNRGTNEELVRESYNIVYIRLRHINLGCRAITESKF